MIDITQKPCPKCLKKRDLDSFLKINGKPSGACSNCRCAYHKEYNKKRYASEEARKIELERGREKYARYGRTARQERKKKLIIEMGGKCVLCNYNKSSAALDFDHIDPATKSRTVSHLLAINQPWAWEAALEEAKKCRLICSNCHREVTFPGHDL